MTELNQVYKCEICGNVVEVLHKATGELVCCGQPMDLQQEKTQDEGQEKHVPIIENNKVKVGSVPHPMEESHFIEWIEATTETAKCKKTLKPGDTPEAEFEEKPQKARAYCNAHGLWTS